MFIFLGEVLPEWVFISLPILRCTVLKVTVENVWTACEILSVYCNDVLIFLDLRTVCLYQLVRLRSNRTDHPAQFHFHHDRHNSVPALKANGSHTS